MFLAEDFYFDKGASIVFDQSNANMGKKLHSNFAQTHITTERENKSVISEMSSLFLLGDIFAMRMRYNLASLGCDMPRYARRDMI